MDKKVKQNKLLSFFVVVGGIFLIVFLILLIMLNSLHIITFISKKTMSTKLPDPITEVTNVEEMENYLGYKVPIIYTKSVSKYIVIGENKKAEHARVEYLDSSVFNMEMGNKDVSGIYGGSEETVEPIDGINVTIYRYYDYYYALWSYKNYSYSYSVNNNMTYLINDVTNLISIIKNNS